MLLHVLQYGQHDSSAGVKCTALLTAFGWLLSLWQYVVLSPLTHFDTFVDYWALRLVQIYLVMQLLSTPLALFSVRHTSSMYHCPWFAVLAQVRLLVLQLAWQPLCVRVQLQHS
jgi:hypothetical protein